MLKINNERKMKKHAILLVLIFTFTLGALDLTPYNTIVCFGDSITHGGYYHMYLQEYLAETDPAHPRHVINRGISGNTTADLLKRVNKILQTDKPDLVIILIGINDLQFTTRFAEKDLPYDQAAKKYPIFDRFEKNLGKLIDILNNANVKVVLLGTLPYNESTNPAITAPLKANLNTSGVQNLQVIEKRLAKQKQALFIDTYTPILKNLQENDATFPRGKTDRVHPSQQEHLIVAQTILGNNYTPGPKLKEAMQYREIQAQIQGIDALYGRIPNTCQNVDDQVAFYKKWVASLKGKDFEYWNRRLPNIINTLKNPDAELKVYRQKRDEAFSKLYQK